MIEIIDKGKYTQQVKITCPKCEVTFTLLWCHYTKLRGQECYCKKCGAKLDL